MVTSWRRPSPTRSCTPLSREPTRTQRVSIAAQIGARNTQLVEAMRIMESNLEEPVAAQEIAASVGLSRRQLERLFSRHLGQSPQRYYRGLRLSRARMLLLQTDLSVLEIAVATGFSAPSHFSKCYREQFGHSPFQERGIPSRL